MSTAVAERTQATDQLKQAPQLPAVRGPRLPYHPALEKRFGIDSTSWRALVESIFPNAQNVESVILALSYCQARKLDVFKRVVHIVPIWSSEKKCMVDTVWPGIGELRTTAFRTGEYAGRGETTFGPTIKKKLGSVEMEFPEWAQITVFRMVRGVKVSFAGPRVYWEETYATKKRDDDTPNEMWLTRPRGQIDKCAEAAALRCAFPEEIGSEYIPEEVQHGPKGQVVDAVNGKNQLAALTDKLNGEAAAHEATGLESGETVDANGEIHDAETSEGEQAATAQSQDAQGPTVSEELAIAFEGCATIKEVGDMETAISAGKTPEAIELIKTAAENRRRAIRANRGAGSNKPDEGYRP